MQQPVFGGTEEEGVKRATGRSAQEGEGSGERKDHNIAKQAKREESTANGNPMIYANSVENLYEMKFVTNK